MKKVLSLVLLAGMLLALLPVSGVQAAGTTAYGDPVNLGNGNIRTFLTTDQNAAGTLPVAFGVEFSRGALMELPTAESDGKWCMGEGEEAHCLGGHELLLPLPPTASAVPFRWVMVNWNPYGHPPPGIYNPPHFDFHFYMEPQASRQEVHMGMCQGPMAGPPAPVDCETLGRAMTPIPAPLNPAGYINPAAVEPYMGAHLINLMSPEFQGQRFNHTFIWGAFDGDITFSEPMITREFIMAQIAPACAAAPQPQMFGRDGWYPTQYCVRYDPMNGSYRVSVEDFRLHQDRESLVRWVYEQQLCRAGDNPGVRAWAGSSLSIARIQEAISMSDEGKRMAAVRALYQELLGRDPVTGDCAGLRSWTAGPWSIDEIRAAFMQTREYQSRAPGTM